MAVDLVADWCRKAGPQSCNHVALCNPAAAGKGWKEGLVQCCFLAAPALPLAMQRAAWAQAAPTSPHVAYALVCAYDAPTLDVGLGGSQPE